ncbi:D-amino acid dehydrogenase [Shinella pollutisoli]|uniref:D-amino acid dehydrogenase n=1 Tax=Shinella pollutisoli TaxID=2250594 RepID=A0ABV7DM95_9HYPH|nr:D-amino acid dehydrogenase [Shinella pollutisoli]
MRAVVVGGGIVGAATAFRLAEAGLSVTLVERNGAVGMETSFANAGQLSPTMAAPWAVPGLAAKALKWMFMRHPPLRISRLDLATAGWLWRMLRAATPEAFIASKRAMVTLSMESRAEMQRLRDRHGLDFARGGSGTLVLLRSSAMAAAYEADLRILDDMGLPYARLTRADVLAREPNLRRDADFHSGVLLTADDTGDCHEATGALVRLAADAGAQVLTGTDVASLVVESGAARAVRLSDGETIEADLVVLAAGVRTPALVRPLGLDLPVHPLKGYSLTIHRDAGAEGPVSTISDDHHKVGVTNLGAKIRVGGTAELAGYDLSRPARRFATLEHVVRDLFPAIPEEAIATADRWSGLRPSTPDGPPVIGPVPGIRNLLLNTGHGTLGWTMAAGSAGIVAALAAGEHPALDIRPFSPSRFSRRRA